MTNDSQVFVCESCGHPTTVADDVCPNCGEAMTNIDSGVKTNPAHDNDDELTDDDIAAGSDDNAPLSLEALREDEEEEDQADYSRKNSSDE